MSDELNLGTNLSGELPDVFMDELSGTYTIRCLNFYADQKKIYRGYFHFNAEVLESTDKVVKRGTLYKFHFSSKGFKTTWNNRYRKYAVTQKSIVTLKITRLGKGKRLRLDDIEVRDAI